MPLKTLRSGALLFAAIFSGAVALLHLGCIVFGAPWYRFLGAGERMVTMAERGHWYPPVLTAMIVIALTVCTSYALSGAGLVRRLPLLRTVLIAIAAVYLFRGLGVAAFVPYFPDNSLPFWLVTSSACVFAGALHVLGLRDLSR